MDKKTIVITGSTRGIGYGLASQLLKRGHQLVINGTNEASVGKRVEEFKNQGYEVLGIAGYQGDRASDFGEHSGLDGRNQSRNPLFQEAGLW